MAPLKVALDVQHLYRGGIHARDRGTRFVGPRGLVVWEADLALGYASGLALALEAAGASVLRNDVGARSLVGPYWRRHAQAKAWGANLYLAAHVNAGGGSYALTEYLAGTGSFYLATSIGAALDRTFGEVLGAHARVMVPGQRGYGCLPAGARGVLLEPFFGDKRTHQALFDPGRLAEVGRVIARAVLASLS